MAETRPAESAGAIGILKLVAAFLFLLAATGLFRLADFQLGPAPKLLLLALPLPALAALFLALLLLGEGRRRLPGVAAAPLLGLLLIWNLGELFYRYFYREHFRLLSDLAYLPGLAAMLSGIDALMRPPGSVLIVTAAILAAGAVGLLLVRPLLLLVRVFEETPRRRSVAAGAALLLIALQLLLIPRQVPVMIVLDSLFRDAAAATAGERSLQPGEESQQGAAQEETWAFPGIRDGDIHIFIVESYGHTLFTNPRHREAVAPFYAELEERLVGGGWSVSSGFVRSPAFGGRSWLADATILTGVQIETQEQYDSMTSAGPENLTGILGRAGYFRLMAAPGTREADEQWRDYYRFDRYLFRYDFDYQGPFVSFGAMPDQYLLYRSGELLAGVEAPVFALYIMVSTHVPFEVIPEYIPDWSRLGRGEIYGEGFLRNFDNNWLSGSEYPEGFIAGVEYSLRSIEGYLERYIEDSSLVLIIGDHQPRIPVSERDATYSVPLHVLSRSSALLERLPRSRFSEGLIPAGIAEEHPPMAEVPRYLLELLAGGAAP